MPVKEKRIVEGKLSQMEICTTQLEKNKLMLIILHAKGCPSTLDIKNYCWAQHVVKSGFSNCPNKCRGQSY